MGFKAYLATQAQEGRGGDEAVRRVDTTSARPRLLGLGERLLGRLGLARNFFFFFFLPKVVPGALRALHHLLEHLHIRATPHVSGRLVS